MAKEKYNFVELDHVADNQASHSAEEDNNVSSSPPLAEVSPSNADVGDTESGETNPLTRKGKNPVVIYSVVGTLIVIALAALAFIFVVYNNNYLGAADVSAAPNMPDTIEEPTPAESRFTAGTNGMDAAQHSMNDLTPPLPTSGTRVYTEANKYSGLTEPLVNNRPDNSRFYEGGSENEWIVSQLRSAAMVQEKRILQLEAQVAMLSLDLTKQKAESHAAVQAASEAGKAVLVVRDNLKVMRQQVSDLKSDIGRNREQIAEGLSRIDSATRHYDGKHESREKKVAANAKQSVSKPVTEPSIPNKQDVPIIKQLQGYDPVMVTERGAYVRNLVTDNRRTLELGAKYRDIGRITRVDPQNNRVYGVTADGTSWVIQKAAP